MICSHGLLCFYSCSMVDLSIFLYFWAMYELVNDGSRYTRMWKLVGPPKSTWRHNRCCCSRAKGILHYLPVGTWLINPKIHYHVPVCSSSSSDYEGSCSCHLVLVITSWLFARFKRRASVTLNMSLCICYLQSVTIKILNCYFEYFMVDDEIRWNWWQLGSYLIKLIKSMLLLLVFFFLAVSDSSNPRPKKSIRTFMCYNCHLIYSGLACYVVFWGRKSGGLIWLGHL